ncbi:hypothetical protein P12x_004415 [Tundrisphaera lichenicola]|uniref:hypothetical protein n=1 Tax=Tundrisphaera lichenicola TaxID=2029860 RepID=UPI003EC0D661
MTIVLVLVAALAVPTSWGVRSLMMTRRAVLAYTQILTAANGQDIENLRSLCTDRYLRDHPPEVSPGGGIIGLPRGIHKNFQAWRVGEEVWLCPTNRVGPVYRFVFHDDRCEFDGLVGLLRAGGKVEKSDRNF